MGVHSSFCAAFAALLGAVFGHAAWAQPQRLGEGVERAHLGASVAHVAPVRPVAVERSELWVVIDAQRRQPVVVGAERGHRRLTPEQRLELREQVRRAYDRPAGKPARP